MNDVSIGSKVCSHCRKEKSFANFWKRNSAPDGHQGICRVCAPLRARGLESDGVTRLVKFRERIRAKAFDAAEEEIEPEDDIEPFIRVDDADEKLCDRVFRAYEREGREAASLRGERWRSPRVDEPVQWSTMDQAELEDWLDRVRLGAKTCQVTKKEEHDDMALTEKQQRIADGYNAGKSYDEIAKDVGSTAAGVSACVVKLRKRPGVITRLSRLKDPTTTIGPKIFIGVPERSAEDLALDQLRAKLAELDARRARLADVIAVLEESNKP